MARSYWPARAAASASLITCARVGAAGLLGAGWSGVAQAASSKALARQAIRGNMVAGFIGHSFTWRTLPLGRMGGALVEAIIDRQFFCQIEINQQRRSSTPQRRAAT